MQGKIEQVFLFFGNERGSEVFTFIPGFQTRGFPVHFYNDFLGRALVNLTKGNLAKAAWLRRFLKPE